MEFDADQQIHQLQQTISILELMCNSIDESLVLLNKMGEITWCNALFLDLINQRYIEILGKVIYEILDLKNILPITTDLKIDIQAGKWIINEFQYAQNNKDTFLQVSAMKCLYEKEDLYVVIIRDISLQKKLQNQLEHLAHYDLLTNLPNRLQLKTFFKRELTKAKRHNSLLGIFFVDLDNFKEINDKYGHTAGDLFLKLVAQRLEGAVRAEDFVARYGGDEFLVIISDFNDKAVAEILGEKIKESLGNPYQIYGHNIHNKASIGVAFYPSDGNDLEKLIDTADLRMYTKKRR